MRTQQASVLGIDLYSRSSCENIPILRLISKIPVYRALTEVHAVPAITEIEGDGGEIRRRQAFRVVKWVRSY
ncbi:MAG TPA: hypothetical protein DIW81_20225 [Planctomycetaceae bacterium]|nr:hypothetical protein [Rubinisphaera sp.]HCS53881.1 hypothetical protein [Planctomycetaceae bacterium]